MSKKLKSYGRYKEFEIRDISKFAGIKNNHLVTVTEDSMETGRFDLVKWESEAGSKPFCFTIGFLIWDKKEEMFKFESCGLRYFEHSDHKLNQWLIRWCNLKALELEEE